MPTITEIKSPKFFYCKKYDIHCPCKKCESSFKLGYKLCKIKCEDCEGLHKTLNKTLEIKDGGIVGCMTMAISKIRSEEDKSKQE